MKEINLDNTTKEPVIMVHSVIGTQLENWNIPKKDKGLECKLDGKKLLISDELTCDVLIKRIIQGKEVTEKVTGYITLVID
ncbi:hypothetical protein [Clostridium baratii]|uniref:hypothetical protein n=1 Tax=Clostridium baratii TaxID=1561 RepID=UPI0030D1AF73